MATIPQGLTDPNALRSHLDRVGNYWWRIEKATRTAPNAKGPQHAILLTGHNTADAAESNLDFLVETLGYLGPGQYIVASQPPNDADKWRSGGMHTPFTVAGATSTHGSAMPGIAGTVSAGAAMGGGFISKVEMTAAISEAREKWDLERRLDDLQAQLEAPQSVWERIGDALLPHADKILPPVMDRFGVPKQQQRAVISGFTGQTPAVPAQAATAGQDVEAIAPDDEPGEVTPEQQAAYDQAIHQALVDWHSAEPDLLTVIQALGRLAHQDPQKYAMGKKLLGL